MIELEQGAWDSFIEILAGILFITPLKAMFKRSLKYLQSHPDAKESFFKYHLPFLFRHLSHKK